MRERIRMGMAPCFLEMPSRDLRKGWVGEERDERDEDGSSVRAVHVLHADAYMWLLHERAVKAHDERRRAAMHDL